MRFLPSGGHDALAVCKRPLDELVEKQRAELKSEPDILRTAALTGLDCDQLPNGSGSFGHTPANPVSVHGACGEFKYLIRLRCHCGVGLMFHRIGSQLVAGIPGSVDAYEVVCLNGKHWDGLCLHMYHPHRSRRLPDGYTIAAFHPVISLAMSF